MSVATAAMTPRVWRIVQIGCTVGLAALLWTAADGPAILRTLGTANLAWLIAAVGALMCQTLLSAWRWKITAGALGQELTLQRAVREYFISQAVNQALPGGVLGDASRAVRARADVGLARAGLAVGLERLAGQIAMFLALICGFSLTYLHSGGLEWPPQLAAVIWTVIGGVIGGITVFILIWAYLGLRNEIWSRWLDMARCALVSRDVLPGQIGLGIAITLCNLAAFGFCAWAVDVQLSVGAIFTVVPIILFSMLIPLTVSGWGVRESSAAVLLPLAGAEVPDAVATSVLFGIAMLLAVLPSLFIMVAK